MAEVTPATATALSNVANQPTPGTANLETQLPGQATTAAGIAAITGGVAPGNVIEPDLDDELFEFEGDDTPALGLMLKAKKVPVTSSIVRHCAIDEEKTSFVTDAVSTYTNRSTAFAIKVPAKYKSLLRNYDKLRVRGVAGYGKDGSTVSNYDLTLLVVNNDMTTTDAKVIAVNGKATGDTIKSGTTIDILSTAVHETLAEVAPDSFVPVTRELYLQKHVMTRIMSDYFESQKKGIPFNKAVEAEHAIRKFKRGIERDILIGSPFMTTIQDPKTGIETIYGSEGLRWQVTRELAHTGKWTYEEFIALAKMAYTGADVPKEVIILCGKNFMENIQCIDFSKHPEVQITVVTNSLGWKVTNIHTVFGDLQFKRCATMEKVGYSNSALCIGMGRVVNYERTTEHTDSERVEGHEADRESHILWMAPGLKGSCHLFINGDGDETTNGATNYILWKGSAMPAAADVSDGDVVYLTEAIGEKAVGSVWLAKVSSGNVTYTKYTGDIATMC